MFGSSPRVRGKRMAPPPNPPQPGLIPACAGKTYAHSPGRSVSRAHPRACGENAIFARSSFVAYGSSPRVRGKLREEDRSAHHRRLIPARAGKTSWRRRQRPARRAHPRVCGENDTDAASSASASGSSPRVRGKPRWQRSSGNTNRLIPARAGKTSSGRASSRGCGAHPRACGENPGAALPGQGLSGSSPRVRGKHLRHGIRVPRAGLIPARAGKTLAIAHSIALSEAHPRACGENSRGASAAPP